MKKITGAMSVKTCKKRIKEALDSWMMPGQERNVGFVLGSFLWVCHVGGGFSRAAGTSNVTACGRLVKNGSGCELHYVLFPALSDPLSVLLLLLGALLIFLFAMDIVLWQASLAALVWTAAVEGLTLLVWLVQPRAQENKSILNAFLSDILKSGDANG